MRHADRILVIAMLLWGFFGFMARYAYRNHDPVGFGVGRARWLIWPVGIAGKRQP
jgi:hypothetical protein